MRGQLSAASYLLLRQGYSLLSWKWRRRDALRPTSYLDNAPAIKYLFHFAFFFHNIAVYKSLIVHELLVYFNSKLMMWCRIYHETSFSNKINSTYTYSGLSLNVIIVLLVVQKRNMIAGAFQLSLYPAMGSVINQSESLSSQ